MSKVFDRAVARIRTLPEGRQDELGEVLMSLADAERGEIKLTKEQAAEVRRRLADLREPVTEEDADAFFARLP